MKRLLVAAVLLCCLAVVAAGSAAPSRSAESLPATPAGKQAQWLLAAVGHLPIPDAAISAHFDGVFLSQLPKPAAASLNSGFVGVRSLQVDSIQMNTPDALVFIVTVNGKTRLSVTIRTDAKGLIGTLFLRPAGAASPAPTPPVTAPVPKGVRQLAVEVGSPPLRGTLTLPPGKGPFAAVLLVSGSGPNDQDETVGPNKPFRDIALGLAARGIASLRYDKRTHDYPGSVNAESFTPTLEYVPDALAAINLLQHRSTVNPERIFVLGHSLGGTYAPLIAKRAPELAGVILLAAATEDLGKAIERQTRYLATLPGSIGAAARGELSDVTREAAQIDSIATLSKDSASTLLLGGVGPRYYLSELAYNPVATARAIRQPLLLLQGDRDYQVTVANDLDVWINGLEGRKGVTIDQFPGADHLFLDGSGRPSPADYARPAHVDPTMIADIAAWIDGVRKNRTAP